MPKTDSSQAERMAFPLKALGFVALTLLVAGCAARRKPALIASASGPSEPSVALASGREAYYIRDGKKKEVKRKLT